MGVERQTISLICYIFRPEASDGVLYALYKLERIELIY